MRSLRNPLTLAAVAVPQPGVPRINLVGMGVGDPCTDNKAQVQPMAMTSMWRLPCSHRYAHRH